MNKQDKKQKWKTKKEKYNKYLRSQEWEERKDKFIKKMKQEDRYHCNGCGKKKNLSVHHFSYISYRKLGPGKEKDSHLRLLCNRCHFRHHVKRWKNNRSPEARDARRRHFLLNREYEEIINK